MRIFVIGASGFLGRYIWKHGMTKNVSLFGSHHTFPFKNTIQLDLLDATSIKKSIEKISPDVIIHCASMRINQCEKDPKMGKMINVEGTKNIVKFCKENNIHLIFISSDAVFSGSSEFHYEETPTNPIGKFGETKVECESLVSTHLSSYCIIRTSLLFGWDSRQSNFVQWVIEKLEQNQTIQVLSDQFVTPSYCKNVAELIMESAAKKMNGIYHLSGNEKLSRSEFAFLISNVFNLNEKLIIPTPFDKLNLERTMIQSSPLDNSFSKKIFNTPIMSITESLKDMVKERKSTKENSSYD